LRLWSEHRGTTGLPRWRVVGLEVLDREIVQARGAGGMSRPLVASRVARL
jgi:hypothetical protein